MKSVNINNKPVITPSMEKAVSIAFELFDTEVEVIKIPQREHLVREFRPGVSCDHTWRDWPKDVPVKSEDEYDVAQWCSKCGTTALRESGKIFAVDTTARFFGKVRAPKPERRTDRKQ